ncbi:aminotransferase class I/II-fold pyridoxal phosphate-dependent enzyme [Nonomuraea sp. NPDC049684]|uniref:aminotransferase class I/II-fold pyridoxal phosphate-dependent enzyme n=1 Tax=Nonomuraea sp. NPDC049684 TaxID=3364356 RepID=UPI0037A06B42
MTPTPTTPGPRPPGTPAPAHSVGGPASGSAVGGPASAHAVGGPAAWLVRTAGSGASRAGADVAAVASPAGGRAGPGSHGLRWEAGVVQSVVPPGTTDLGPGYLGPGLLPVDLLAEAYAEAMATYGAAALAYGDDRGALALRTTLARRACGAPEPRGSYAPRGSSAPGGFPEPGGFSAPGGFPAPGRFPEQGGSSGGSGSAATVGSSGLGDNPGPGGSSGAGGSCGPDGVLITAGTSQALHLLATTLARPGDAVLVEDSCYDLGRLILTDCGLRTYGVPGDASGMDPQALDAALTRTRPAFVYLNPTFHNPTGRVVPLARRRELLAVARRHATTIVEDDAYADLRLDGGAGPPALACLDGHQGVIRLGTFSKSLAPGLRLGWLTAEPAMADRLAVHGVLQSGGCPNHTTSLAVATLLERGHYDRHLLWLRERLRERRDALVDAFTARLDGGFALDRPAGGLFVWVRADRPEAGLLAAARRAGVLVAAGSRFTSASGSTASRGRGTAGAVRLAYGLNTPDQLAAAAKRLAAAWNAIPPET